jgi:nitroreductase
MSKDRVDKYQERYLAHQGRKREVLRDLLESRHSARVFSDAEVPAEALADVYHAALRAPSSCDRKGVGIYEVTDRDSKALLGGVLVGGVGWIHRAPVIILFMADQTAYKAGNEIEYMPYLDAGCMVSQMYLAATATGLKVCFVNPQIREHNKTHFSDMFGDGLFCGAMALGLPPEQEMPDWVRHTS